MKVQNPLDDRLEEVEYTTGHDLLLPLVGRATTNADPLALNGGVVVGELIGLARPAARRGR